MISAFGVDHGETPISKLALKTGKVPINTKKGQTIYKPKGKLRRLKAGAVNATTKVGTAGPSPLTVVARSVTPLRTFLHV